MSVITLVYLFELSHSSIHGFVGCMHQFFNVCGLVLTNVLSAFLDFRIISIINAIISFIFSGLVWVTRDSPVSSRVQKLTKQKTLMKITDKNSQKVKKSKIRKYIKKKRDHDFYKYTIYGIILFVFQQLSGANAILSHLSQIMSNSGLSINPNLQSALANGSQLIAIFISALLVSNIGQRVLWCVSAFLCCLFLVLYSLTMKYSFPSYAQALFIFYYRLCFGFGVGPMTFATWVQLFSDKTRLLGTSIMMAGHFAISWVVVYCHPIISKKCGEFIMTLIYAVFMVLSIVFGACCIPENKVKDNEDMALI
ncbi:major facilitator superfamily transporter [Tritrichomonas foetus]|uniref:Major facilitator superfamily transporter n=1 Tax=Tritrichomonas foetus TaxID=1144522 RepID=A0A1J4JJD7_9EUKA|nr:major facilitator superfamily transporter [Tritrichomonas foetus]|eukprot:OHS99272.1 major facilitator superfamily transporter [Tritrichomonas foetus]